MATLNETYGSPISLTVTNLHSLSDGSYWQSESLDNGTSGGWDYHVRAKLATTTTAASAQGHALIFVATSNDGTDFDGEASGTEGSYAPNPGADEQSRNLYGPKVVSMQADETTARDYERQVSVRSVCGFMPKFFSLVILNNTGTGLASSGNEIEYVIENPQSSS